MSGRVIVYGDIHGCLDEFKALRKKISPTKEDIEISVGDFLNKGPKSLKTLRYIKKRKILSVIGNNEAKMIRFYKEKKRGSIINCEFKKGERELLLSMKKRDYKFLKSLPYFIKIENLTVVHAGIPHWVHLNKKLSKEDKKWLMHLRFYDKDLKPLPLRFIKERYKFWSEMYDGREGFVVFGHHPFDRVKRDKFSLGIDTGCVYGGRLTAAVFPYNGKSVDTSSYKLYEVRAKRDHYKTLLES
jgi:bis(5'-nucleosyl)-tetraphosphatase (symmetrical)